MGREERERRGGREGVCRRKRCKTLQGVCVYVYVYVCVCGRDKLNCYTVDCLLMKIGE